MASSFQYCFNILLCSLLVFFIITPSLAKTSTSLRPRALVLPVRKDKATLQYLTTFRQRTPLVPLKLTLDLGGPFLWVNCDGYVTSTYKATLCGAPDCKLANSNFCNINCISDPTPPGCDNTCGLSPDNTVTRSHTEAGQLGQDVASLHATDGSNPTALVSIPNLLFSCASTSLLQGLAAGVTGMAGLGRSTPIGLPSQFASAFGFPRRFALCLPSSTKSKGVVFFGNEPYVLLPGIDVSNSLTFTPLILNPVTTAVSIGPGPSAEYFIGVKSIKVNGKVVSSLNASLLAIDTQGNGGTKISTVDPYTVLETSIYKAVVKAFVKQLSHVPTVKPVAPFGVCFNSKNISSTRVGPGVPAIDLVLQSKSVYWSINGANSMVRVSKDVLCLGIVDGGVNPRTSIVIGGHQLEDNLVQFDIGNKRLGFSSSLLARQTTCANFNFTSKTA